MTPWASGCVEIYEHIIFSFVCIFFVLFVCLTNVLLTSILLRLLFFVLPVCTLSQHTAIKLHQACKRSGSGALYIIQSYTGHVWETTLLRVIILRKLAARIPTPIQIFETYLFYSPHRNHRVLSDRDRYVKREREINWLIYCLFISNYNFIDKAHKTSNSLDGFLLGWNC